MIKTFGNKLYVIWEETSQNKNSDIYLCSLDMKNPKECNYKINVSNNTNNSIQPSFDISNDGNVFVT